MKLKLMTLIAVTATAFTMAAKAETKSEDLPGMAPQPASSFYTGKPYDADLGAYMFNYRNYDVELNRWTTSDPSGFPDGPNGHFYAPRPTSELDPVGCSKMSAAAGALHYVTGDGESVTEAFSDYYDNHSNRFRRLCRCVFIYYGRKYRNTHKALRFRIHSLCSRTSYLSVEWQYRPSRSSEKIYWDRNH